MLTRRALAKFVGAAALSGGLPFGLAAQTIAQSAAAPLRRCRAERTSSRMARW
jgi:hypothetical protein